MCVNAEITFYRTVSRAADDSIAAARLQFSVQQCKLTVAYRMLQEVL